MFQAIAGKAEIVVRHFVQFPDMGGGQNQITPGFEYAPHFSDHPPGLRHVLENLGAKYRGETLCTKGQIHATTPHIGRDLGIAHPVVLEPRTILQKIGIGPPTASHIEYPPPGIASDRFAQMIPRDPLDQPVGRKKPHPILVPVAC